MKAEHEQDTKYLSRRVGTHTQTPRRTKTEHRTWPQVAASGRTEGTRIQVVSGKAWPHHLYDGRSYTTQDVRRKCCCVSSPVIPERQPNAPIQEPHSSGIGPNAKTQAHKIVKGNGIERNPICHRHMTKVFSKPAVLWIALTVSRYYSS